MEKRKNVLPNSEAIESLALDGLRGFSSIHIMVGKTGNTIWEKTKFKKKNWVGVKKVKTLWCQFFPFLIKFEKKQKQFVGFSGHGVVGSKNWERFKPISPPFKKTPATTNIVLHILLSVKFYQNGKIQIFSKFFKLEKSKVAQLK